LEDAGPETVSEEMAAKVAVARACVQLGWPVFKA
jgi:hypothetical protein